MVSNNGFEKVQIRVKLLSNNRVSSNECWNDWRCVVKWSNSIISRISNDWKFSQIKSYQITDFQITEIIVGLGDCRIQEIGFWISVIKDSDFKFQIII